MNEKTHRITSLIVPSILLAAVFGCIPPATQPSVLPTPTPPPGWETYSASAEQGQCGYSVNHPSPMSAARQGMYDWLLGYTSAELGGPLSNFIYISVIPDDFQNDGSDVIYNYEPAETQTLLNMQVGESRALRDDPTLESWFTYTRLSDAMLGGQAAKTYENTQPWEFPLGTKEIRYYLQVNGCTYLIGGYLATVGSGQTGAIDEELFDQIIASFRPAS